MEHELRLQPGRTTTNRILRYLPKESGSVADGGRPRPIAVRDFNSRDYIPRLHPRLMEVTQISASIYELKAIGPRDATHVWRSRGRRMARATCHSDSTHGISVASVIGASTKAEGMTLPVPKSFLGPSMIST